MARGWESKGVEEQINERLSKPEKSMQQNVRTAAEAEQQATRQGLQRAKERTLASLTSTKDEKSKALLEKTLADLEARLAALG